MTPSPAEPAGAVKLRQRLVDQLAAAGALSSPRWRRAFEEVPRHVFVPAFSRRGPDGQAEHLDSGRDPRGWLEAAYHDDSLVTQRDQAGAATSSSSQPTVMAVMLEALCVHDGQRVLEIGTGTGYNAALLCHRLGDDKVTSVDVDAGLVQTARDRLASLGYCPALAVGDGLAGWPNRAPYDRIIATCGTRRTPAAWLAQTRPGGMIVANIGRGLIALHRNEHGVAAGRFSPVMAAFMPARAGGTQPTLSTHDGLDITRDERGGRTRPTSLFTDIFAEDFAFLAAITAPELLHTWSEGEWYAVLDPTTDSWARAEHHPGGTTTTQHGPRALWSELEAAHRAWTAAGRPAHDRYGLTVTPDGRHTLWLDEPDQRSIPLPQ